MTPEEFAAWAQRTPRLNEKRLQKLRAALRRQAANAAEDGVPEAHRICVLQTDIVQALLDDYDELRGAAGGYRRVVVESPYAGTHPDKRSPQYANEVLRNLVYLRACMRDCVLRGESPYASHALLTQPGVLDDADPAERERGIAAGLAWGVAAHATVVYTDLGTSNGMRRGVAAAESAGRTVEYRTLPGWKPATR